MAVRRMTEIRPGINVNIVLKADQRTGKLTSGQVSDILNRGDHLRGIKVRLIDGQIGRVQSLCSPSSSKSANSSQWSSLPKVHHHVLAVSRMTTVLVLGPQLPLLFLTMSGRRSSGREEVAVSRRQSMI